MSRWPKDTPAALKAFYGDPGKGEIEPQLVSVVPPFRMTYEGKPIKAIRFHRKAAPGLAAALNTIWEHYGRDQSKIDALGISKYAGAYNPRLIRGSKTKWSNHAYGAAIDLNADENGLGQAGNMPAAVVAAFEAQGARWGGRYQTRKDPMHFEFCDNGRNVQVAALTTANDPGAVMDDSDPGLVFRDEPEEQPAPAPATVTTDGVQGDPELWSVQRRLKAMNFNPGGLDGKWGSMTSGAISGFINDRRLNLAVPTSVAMFNATLPHLKTELQKAEGEGFSRKLFAERTEADEESVAKTAPEIKPVAINKKIGFWGAITAGFSAVTGWLSDNFPTAMSWVQQIKYTLDGVPGYVWFGVAAAGLVVVYQLAKQGKAGITEAVQKGERL